MVDTDRPQSPIPSSMKHRNSPPPSPPSPDPAEAQFKLSRKREREVSLEPVLSPKPLDIDPQGRESRKPAKKNRLQLGTTEEEEDAGSQASSQSGSPPLGISPPQELKMKVRQISRGVEDLSWRKNKSESPEGRSQSRTRQQGEDVQLPPQNQSQASVAKEREDRGKPLNQGDKVEENNTPPKSPTESHRSQSVPDIRQSSKEHEDATTIPHTVKTQHLRTDSDGDKGLKRKFLERGTSQGPQDTPDTPKSPAEPTKRLRDDPDRDENPREAKRPSPPPEKSLPKAPTSPKMTKKSGFESFASTSSPFAAVKGQNIFGSGKSSFGNIPSSQKSAPTTSAASPTPAKSPSPFGISALGEPSTPSTAPAKRSAFEVFASPASPFASITRSKSPVTGSTSKLGRAKSPPRFSSSASSSAFSSYAKGVQTFAAHVPKRPRAESPNGLSNGKKSASVLSLPDDQDSGGSEDSEILRVPTFGERLRTEKDDDEESRSDDESLKALLTEQTVTTGEEDEETIHQVRGKLYALQGNQWKEKGTGTLKLNVKRDDGRGARLVMRKEAVFTLLLNVTLFNGMRCGVAQDPRYLRFSVIESGSTVHYNLRVPNAKIAQELLEEINANIPPA
ncbi:hypothetical protein JOM56_007751 [Amanita muscaria]